MSKTLQKIAQALTLKSQTERKTIKRRALRVEALENRELFAVAPLAPLGSKSTLLIPAYTSPVRFTADFSDTASKNELGYFFVDGPDGRLTRRQDADIDSKPLLNAQGQPQYLRPGDRGYLDLALASWNSEVIFASGEVSQSLRPNKTLDVSGDRFIAFFIIKNASVADWRNAPANSKPNAWVSLGDANSDKFEHFQATRRQDPFFRNNILQYRVEDSNLADARARKPGNDSDINDLVFSVNILPYLNYDDYSVFNRGANFSGAPEGFKLDAKSGLLANDYLPSNPNVKPTLTHISIDGGTTWLEVLNAQKKQNRLVVSDPSLHGTLTVFTNGAMEFQPSVNDPYWKIKATDQTDDPDPVVFMYRAFDGLDSAETEVSITHGYYQRGSGLDKLHQGQRMYFLAGGGDSTSFNDGRSEFFQKGSNGKDIVLVSQGIEQLEFINDVFDVYAAGKVRSVTSVNITTRAQAMDPRIASIISGADAIWFGGGAQSLYQSIFVGTPLFSALANAARSNVAIGGTSAGMAMLGQSAYIDVPWDSVKSRFVTQQPQSPRVQIMTQGSQLPFAGLTCVSNAPLGGIITDTHFSDRDRMGRLTAFMARNGHRGLGVDDSTALLISSVGNEWKWTVFGEGNVYLVSPSSNKVTPKYQDGGRLTYNPLNVTRIAAGTTTTQAAALASPTYKIFVSQGTIYTTENGGSLY
jgi:cyanophycinase